MVFNTLNFERSRLVLEKIIRYTELCNEKTSNYNEFLLDLRPETIAKREHIFKDSIYNEAHFQIWSTSRSSTTNILRSIEIFGFNTTYFVQFRVKKLSWISQLILWRPVRVHNKAKLELIPEVFLRKNATQSDIFKSAIIVYKALQIFDTISNSDSIESWNDDHLIRVLKDSYEYQKVNVGDIIKILEGAGWNCNKFMFGSIARRVDW